MAILKKNILSITSISDTHGFPPERFFSDYNSFSGDILVHAGDISTRTTVKDAIDFAKDWSHVAKNYHVFLVGLGNHDQCFDSNDAVFYEIVSEMRKIIPNIVIVGSGVFLYCGIRFGFMPYIPTYKDYSFTASEEVISKKLNEIGHCDILITHIPSKGILDSYTKDGVFFMDGSISVRNYVDNHNPIIHICGHVHSARGITSRAHCLSVNAAMANYIDKNNTLLEQTVFLNKKTMSAFYDNIKEEAG